ncbi:MAG: 50S ribosomal protein L32 [Spirochaetes bacterium GWF1_49_6]|nr:MAG: 50S ribosomal protein L32 [Spirochaetes bacterium GWF1_49_6]
MGLPKHKTSKTMSKRRKSNSYYARVVIPAMSVCPHCGEKKIPHRVCPSCGFYGDKSGGVQVITKAIKEVKE